MLERLIAMIAERSFQMSDTPSFKLASGKLSRYYVNCRIITLDPEGMYLIGNLIDDRMGETLIEVFARGVRRYVETIDHNLGEKDPKARRFERWVFPDFGIKVEDWDKFRDMVHDRLIGVIEDLDTRFANFQRPASDSSDGLTVGVGMYLYKDQNDDERLFGLQLRNLERED